MAKNFLGKLTDSLNKKFSVGENQITNLGEVIDGQQHPYGQLGDYASRIDRTEERKYLEEGYLRTDPFGSKSKQFQILMQQPSATLLIKKRMFSSVADNYKTDYMDKDERLFYRAMKILFQNKCNQISKLESLSKIQKISESLNDLPEALVSLLISYSEGSGGGGFNLFGGLQSQEANSFKETVDKLKRVYFFNKSSNLTKWITDDSNIFSTQFGNGTGVIEITNFTSFTTNNTLSINSPGSARFSITDPYNAMVISEYDIEKSINDATNIFINSRFFQFGKESTEQLIQDLQFDLNKIRQNRGVGNITFHISPETIVGRRVRAIVDSNGLEIPFEYNPGFGGLNNIIEKPSNVVKVATEYYKNGEALGINGLATDKIRTSGFSTSSEEYHAVRYESELSLFIRIVQNLFNQIQMNNNVQSDNTSANEETNYARRKMRFMLLGKNIIQPMDSVHLYVSTKSRYDSRLITGINNMFTGNGILQNLNNSVANLKSSINTVSMMFGGSGSIDTVAEKNMFVGEAFPNFLWTMLRSQFVSEKEGTHIFAGLVERANTSFNDGQYNVEVNCSDNSAYLKKGQVNFKPGVDVFNGSLFDPLTPFKTRFDTVNSNIKTDQLPLLDENVELLSSSIEDVGLVKFKMGPNAGQPVTHDSLIQERKMNPNTQLNTRTFYAPDGLVYRWKEGIGGSVFSGNSLNIDNVDTVGFPSITKDPFAGQDVMNVISLLITGVPYNFRTYWRAVSEFDGFTGDESGNENAANSYYTSLRQNLKKQNVLWGNFIPFKSLTMDEESYKKTLQGVFKSNKTTREVEQKLEKIKELKQQSYVFAAGQELSAEFTIDKTKLNNQITTLSSEIQQLLLEAKDKQQSEFATDYLNSDATSDTGFIENNDNDSSDLTRRSLRRKLTYLTRRMSYNVRANEDKNLFIVDDFYDKDYDLMAFTKDLDNGIELYRNDFTSVHEKIIAAAEVLKLEVFCDTQGHIKVRPPQYNRMPSSIFYRMIDLKRKKGIQVFPEFLSDLFGNQINTLSDRLGVLEDEIRLICAVVGVNDDKSCNDFINNNSDLKGSQFSFLSVEGEITEFDKLTETASPESNDAPNVFTNIANMINGSGNKSEIDKIKDSEIFSKLQDQSKTNKVQYSVYQRSSALLNAITRQKLSDGGYHIHDNFMKNFTENSYIDKLMSRIEIKTGQKVNKYEYITTQELTGTAIVASYDSLDYFKLINDLSSRIRERQKVVKLLAGAVKSAIEFRSLDSDPEQTRNKLLMPSIYGNENVPEVFEHMIEDETYDDYGEGSGSRYIIKDSQIISFDISENPPDYTYVQVRGVLNPYGESLPPGLNNFPDSGNGLVTADAVDYDTWRMYGFTSSNTINMPFFSSPETQCLPYAAMLLGRARKNILRGNITISGNEYMQQGEVVYLESRGLLFYVNSVSHNYQEGQNFTTSLELIYGHVPGEYIPVPLDVIGKMMYNNKDISSYVVQRQTSVFNEENLGALVMDININSSSDISEYKQEKSTYASSNYKTISKIMFNASKILSSNGTDGNNIKAVIELRVFNDGDFFDQELLEFASSIKTMLTGNMTQQILNPVATTDANRQYSLDFDDVVIKKVDISLSSEYRSPSQKALALSRSIADSGISKPNNEGESKTQQYTRKNRIKQSLFTTIVDCCVVFNEVSEEEANPLV